MDEKQQQAFAEAVERKKAQAQAASEQPHQLNPDEGPVPGPQQDPPSADQPTPHHKSSRHGNVTAENWNQ